MEDDTNCSSATTTVHLEVQDGTTPEGDPVWRDAGEVELLDENDGVTFQKDASRQKNTTRNNDKHANSSEETKKPDCHSSAKQTTSNLLSAIKFLAPHVKTKKERQRVMLFRNAAAATGTSNATPTMVMNTNLLIFLHGTGDTHRPYDRLGQAMALPQTATLAIQATSQTSFGVSLPFGLGSSWFHEMDYSSGLPLGLHHSTRVQSLNVAIDKLCHLIHLLVENNNGSDNQGWIPERIFLFGYGSGACLAMETCRRLQAIGQPPLGGSICVSGGCSMDIEATAKRNAKTVTAVAATPILLMTGSKDTTMFPPDKARESASAYNNHINGRKTAHNNVQLHIESNKGQGMISSPSEMKIVMEFLATKLVRMSKMHPS